jgi:hypothetical protein
MSIRTVLLGRSLTKALGQHRVIESKARSLLTFGGTENRPIMITSKRVNESSHQGLRVLIADDHPAFRQGLRRSSKAIHN